MAGTERLRSAPPVIGPMCRRTVGGIPFLNRATRLAFGSESNRRPAP